MENTVFQQSKKYISYHNFKETLKRKLIIELLHTLRYHSSSPRFVFHLCPSPCCPQTYCSPLPLGRCPCVLSVCVLRKWQVIRASWWASPSSGDPFICSHKGPFTRCFSHSRTPEKPRGTFPLTHSLTEVNCHSLKTPTQNEIPDANAHTVQSLTPPQKAQK